VLGDVDVKKVAPRIYGSAFGGVGQICAATKRVYVHESIYDSMVDELADLAREQTETMGPLSTRPQYERVKMLVEDALEHGGKAVTGGEPTGGPTTSTRDDRPTSVRACGSSTKSSSARCSVIPFSTSAGRSTRQLHRVRLVRLDLDARHRARRAARRRLQAAHRG
jgi:hypothetical protein